MSPDSDPYPKTARIRLCTLTPSSLLNGMGIRSEEDDGDLPFLFDGQEAWSWAADLPLNFEGLTFRPGQWNVANDREITISSSDWVGLSGISPGAGISYNSGAGSFVLVNSPGNVIAANGQVLVASHLTGGGVDLTIFAGTDLSFANTDAEGDGTAFTFSNVPEPSTATLLFSGIAFLACIRRKVKK